MKTNISQHLWSQRFESITERITSSLTVCLSNCTKHQLWSVRNLQPKHEGVLAGLTEILPKNTRMMCERCWHFRSYCFPQGISTVAALQCGLVTAGPRITLSSAACCSDPDHLWPYLEKLTGIFPPKRRLCMQNGFSWIRYNSYFL